MITLIASATLLLVRDKVDWDIYPALVVLTAIFDLIIVGLICGACCT